MTSHSTRWLRTAALGAAVALMLSGASAASVSAKSKKKKTTKKKSVATTVKRVTTTTAKQGSAAVNKGTIKIGQLGTSVNATTGAATTDEGRKLLQMWVNDVNGSGGINGYKLELLYRAVNGDSARAIAAVKELAKAGVVALVGNYDVPTAPVIKADVDKAGIAVIGGTPGTDLFTTDPLWFLAGADLDTGSASAALVGQDAGAKSMYTLYCDNLPVCTQQNDVAKATSASLGLKYGASTAPANATDYTAYCLNAKNGNYEYVMTLAINVPQTVRDCARQNYHPIYGLSSGISPSAIDSYSGERIASLSYEFPVWYRGPETAEFVKLARRAFSNIDEPVWGTQGPRSYMAAQVLKAALMRMTVSDPKPADLVAALRTIKGETFGGLSFPITYSGDGNTPNPRQKCIFEQILVDGKPSMMDPSGRPASGLRYNCFK